MGRYGGRSWVDDLVGGMETGAKMDAMIDMKAERRKKAKTVETVAGDMTNKLFNVEDKGPIGNFMWDKFGLGDAPKVTEKADAKPIPAGAGTPGAAAPQAQVAAGAPAGDTPSAMRQAVGKGLTAASSVSGGEAPAASAPPTSQFVWEPTAAPVFAAAAQNYEAPLGAFQDLDTPAQRRRIMQDNPIG